MTTLDADWSGMRLGGRYLLIRQLGRGGMGQVWEARHELLERLVAVKFLTQDAPHTPAQRERFYREAKLTAKVNSRNAVTVFDYGVEDDKPYLVMELLQGETLADRLRRVGCLTPPETVDLLTQAASALSSAHQSGVVHCDFKPENLMISEHEGRDVVKVLDFGIARLRGALSGALSTGEPGAVGAGTQTKAGGTPHYMAPEQIRRQPLTAAADVWAFGVVAYQCLVGTLPFQGADLHELLASVLRRRFAPASSARPGLSPDFDTWFDLACAERAEHRFHDLETAVAALDIALAPNPKKIRSGLPTDPAPATVAPAEVATPSVVTSRRRRAAVPLAAVAAAIVVALTLASPSPEPSSLGAIPTSAGDPLRPSPEPAPTDEPQRQGAPAPTASAPEPSAVVPSGAALATEPRPPTRPKLPRERASVAKPEPVRTSESEPVVEPGPSAPEVVRPKSPFELPELGF